MNIQFENPIFLLLLWSIPLLIITHFFLLRKVRKRAMVFANFEALKRVSGKKIMTKNLLPLFLRVLVILLLVFASAGTVLWVDGVADEFTYVIAIDASGSMLADDFVPNRLGAAKIAAIKFIESIQKESHSTKVGLVTFAGTAYIEEMPTKNLEKIKAMINEIQVKDTHGTAIADAIRVTGNMLSNEDEGRVLVLVTDGRETVAPETTNNLVRYAKQNELTIYAIGVGTVEGGRINYKLAGIDSIFTLDEDALTMIAKETSGVYYRVTDAEALAGAYSDIAKLDKGRISFDLSFSFMLLGLALLFMEWGLMNTKYRQLP